MAARWVYGLPFGKGRKWIHQKYLSFLVSNWSFSGTYDYQPGGLFGWGNNFYYGGPENINLSNPTYGEGVNTAGCGSSPAPPRPGDAAVPLAQPFPRGWERGSSL